MSVVRRYVQRHAKPGDMVTVGETPLAVMQGGDTPNRLFSFHVLGFDLMLRVVMRGTVGKRRAASRVYVRNQNMKRRS